MVILYTSGLQVKLLTPFLQFVNTVLGVSRKVNMDRSSHASSKIGGAGVDVAILSIKHEVLARLSLNTVSNSLDTLLKKNR